MTEENNPDQPPYDNPKSKKKPKPYFLKERRMVREEMERMRDSDEVVRAAEPEIVTEENTPQLPARSRGKQALQRAMQKSADPMTILQGISLALTPEEVADLIDEAIEFARKWKSWEGIVAILRLHLEYTVGKPIQRSVSANLKPEDFAAWLKDENPEEV